MPWYFVFSSAPPWTLHLFDANLISVWPPCYLIQSDSGSPRCAQSPHCVLAIPAVSPPPHPLVLALPRFGRKVALGHYLWSGLSQWAWNLFQTPVWHEYHGFCADGMVYCLPHGQLRPAGAKKGDRGPLTQIKPGSVSLSNLATSWEGKGSVPLQISKIYIC